MRIRPVFDVEIGGRKVRLGERTLVMGVVNVTPDSFSDAGLFLDPRRAVRHALEMVEQGADWIDVGGESTRPGSRPVPAEEELRRVLPVISGLRRRLPNLPISIDTTKAEVAAQAVRAGATVLNDVSGLRFDPRLAEIARRYRTLLILMHLRGRPETMQKEPFARSVWRSVREGLARSIRRALAAGVRRSQLIIDPGMGFGKSRRQNYEILAHFERLRLFKLPILVGTSRKSFVQAILSGEGLEVWRPKRRGNHPWPMTAGVGAQRPSTSAQDGERQSNRPASLQLKIGDSAAVAASILGGAHVVRVHDVQAVLPSVRIADAILASAEGRP